MENKMYMLVGQQEYEKTVYGVFTTDENAIFSLADYILKDPDFEIDEELNLSDDEIDEYTDSQKREMFTKELVQILGDDGSVEMETLGEVFSLHEVTVDKFESVF